MKRNSTISINGYIIKKVASNRYTVRYHASIIGEYPTKEAAILRTKTYLK